MFCKRSILVVACSRWRAAGAALLTAAILAAGPALADPPGGKGQGHGHGKAHGNPNTGGPPGFAAHDRSAIQDYYATPITGPDCPPGLAKKNNGCMPPGQAKQYAIGK